jgi:uncharacterized membrane protein
VLSTVVAVSAVVCAGLVAGALLGDCVAASQARARLDAASFVTFMQTWHRHFVRFVGPLMLIGLVAGSVWLVLAWPHGNRMERALIAASIAGLVVVAGITATVNVPINGQLMTWNAAAPPADLAALWSPWERAHTARALVAAAVLVLDAVALGL